jgi:DNA helicase IV
MPYTYAPPALTDLNREQRMAHGWNDASTDVLILTGCPGSGKTTVTMLRNSGLNCNDRQYVVYANLLKGYLVNSAPRLNIPESFFSTFHSWMWWRTGGWNPPFDKPRQLGDELNAWFVQWSQTQDRSYKEFTLDEGQDLPLEVRCALTHFAKTLVISMDEAQDVRNECQSDELERTKKYLEEALGKTVACLKLNKNWRNTKAVFDFAKFIVPEMNLLTQGIDFNQGTGDRPQVFKFDTEQDYNNELIRILRNETGVNVAVLADSLNKLRDIYAVLKTAGIAVTIYDSQAFQRLTTVEKNHFLKNMSNVVLSTFQSCKGLEFDTVILADIGGMSDTLPNRKGYYVGCTRARTKLVLLFDRSRGEMPGWLQRMTIQNPELFEEF